MDFSFLELDYIRSLTFIIFKNYNLTKNRTVSIMKAEIKTLMRKVGF